MAGGWHKPVQQGAVDAKKREVEWKDADLQVLLVGIDASQLSDQYTGGGGATYRRRRCCGGRTVRDKNPNRPLNPSYTG
jgi:hypothetical protein